MPDPPSSDVAASEAELYLKVGALFVTYFVLETLGYAHGRRVSKGDSDTVQAIRDGMDHLIHFFTPWDRVAWPAGPCICAILLAYSPFMPKLIEVSDPGSLGAFTNWAVLCIGVVISAPIALVALVGAERSARFVWWIVVPKWAIAISFYYACWLSFFAYVAFTRIPSIVPPDCLREAPWPQLIGTVFTGWVLFLTYLGSRFDGALDRTIEDASSKSPQNRQPSPQATQSQTSP